MNHPNDNQPLRKIIVLTFISLDGVAQAPGGPEEDPASGFSLGGWTVPYFDEALGQVMGDQMGAATGASFDLLLGRKTFETFASYWPEHPEDGPEINRAVKYVASNTLHAHPWQPSVFLSGDVVAHIRKLKQQPGPDLQVHGSLELIQTLFAYDLVDELWLKIFPVVLGHGKRLFGGGVKPGALTLVSSQTTPSGVIVASYRRAGEVQTGSFG